MLLVGVIAFLFAYLGFAVGGGLALLALAFLLAGAGIGLVETAENAAVASLAPAQVRGSAFGVLAATQGFGQLVASALVGLLWTAVSPTVAFRLPRRTGLAGYRGGRCRPPPPKRS